MNVVVCLHCPCCNKPHAVKVNKNDWLAYEEGALAQNVFPYLSPTEREQIISNMCPDCQVDFVGW